MDSVSIPHKHNKAGKPPSVYCYIKFKCRCKECVEIYREYHRKQSVPWRKLNQSKLSERSRRYRERYPERVRAAQLKHHKTDKWKQTLSKRRKRKVAERKAIVDRIKLSHGCKDCGYNANPIALQFDHVRGEKYMCVSFAVTKVLNINKILAEIEKCEVVCANCHLIRTEKRRLARQSPTEG